MTTAPVRADAANRGFRTLVQGVAIDVIVAVAAVLLMWLPDADLTSREAWIAVGVAVAKSVLTALASYVMRLKVQPPAPLGDRGRTDVAYMLVVAILAVVLLVLLSRLL